jgi:hypothetical protein
LGAYSYLTAHFDATYLTVGNYTSIAQGFVVGLGHPTDLLTASPVCFRKWITRCEFPGKTEYTYLPTVIGSDVWIGANVVVKAGVTIGDGCFVGAGSIVTKDIPPFSVAAGNPCRVIRPRFNEQTVARILRTRWFDYDWKDTYIDWSNPDLSLDCIENALANGFRTQFNTFEYSVSEEKNEIHFKRIND